jgi:hypothetical protein
MKVIREDNSELEFKTIQEVGEEKASLFRHFKGKEYKILTIAKDCEDLKDLVVYKAEYDNNQCWVREINDFFSLVDKNKYPDIKEKYRFEKIK